MGYSPFDFDFLLFCLFSYPFPSLDNIELNISSVSADTGAASHELTTASDYQRKAGKRAACLMFILVIVIAVVLVAVSDSRLASFGGSTNHFFLLGSFMMV